jgi:hypothetical protein
MPDTPTTPLYNHIDRHFLAPEALKRAALLGRAGPDAGGWFKGELAYVLDTLLKANEIRTWRANVPITEEGRQRCDFRIELALSPDPSPIATGEGKTNALWLEVKALADPARAGPLADSAVFARGSSFTDDIVKLLRVADGDRAVLLFVYPRPEPAQWSELMSAYARRIAPISFTEESDLSAYPPELYVCKLTVSEGF